MSLADGLCLEQSILAQIQQWMMIKSPKLIEQTVPLIGQEKAALYYKRML